MEAQILDNLKKAVLNYDSESASSLAREAIEKEIEPLKIMNVLIEAIRQVGEDFEKGDLFLPDLVGAANALQGATPIVEEAIKSRGGKRAGSGKVIIGTVAGDIHTIGKSIVAAVLSAEGFEVHDIGIDVSTEQFINAVREHAPNILAMSALLTSTAPETKKVIERLLHEGLRDKVKIMVGGGAITEAFAKSIGADGYDPSAPGAAKVARRLLGL